MTDERVTAVATRVEPSSGSETISLVVPALNEEDLITDTVRQILDVVEGRFRDYEIILINDGSADSTGLRMEDLARRYPKIRLIHNPTNVGLGASYRVGCAEARHEYVMMLCGDGGMPASSLPAIFDKVGSADIVVPYCVNLRRIKTPTRYLLSRAYTLLLNVLFGQRLRYYNGLQVHRLELVRSVANESDGFGFQGEILVKLLKAGRSYVEVGVEGAEKTNRSSALRLKNIASVVRTIASLLRHTQWRRGERNSVTVATSGGVLKPR